MDQSLKHPLLVKSISQALKDIFQKHYHADKVISFYLKTQKKWGARDRRFFAQSVYNCVRWWRRLWWDLGYSVPPSDWEDKSIIDLVEAFRQKDDGNFNGPWEVRESIPDWLRDYGYQELGESWPDHVSALNTEAPVYLRVNTLLADEDQVLESLKEEGFEVEKTGFKNALVLKERKNVFSSNSFRCGLFEVQDISSQHVAVFLKIVPKKKMLVVDGCAGAGGKTLHLAALLENHSRILALDVHERKLQELRKRARRAQAHNIECRLIKTNKTIKRLENKADYLLLDVPCSGVGVLRRNPDTKWKLSMEKVRDLISQQRKILEYSRMVKPGGRMVYSTCSIFPSENQKQIQTFLQKHPEWKLEKEQSFSPLENQQDGFYMARLIRL